MTSLLMAHGMQFVMPILWNGLLLLLVAPVLGLQIGITRPRLRTMALACVIAAGIVQPAIFYRLRLLDEVRKTSPAADFGHSWAAEMVSGGSLFIQPRLPILWVPSGIVMMALGSIALIPLIESLSER